MKASGLTRALLASAVLVLAGSGTRGFAAFEKHLKPLPAVLAGEIERKDMSTESAILVRIFKQESELEVWKQDRSGKFALLKTYPICRWSGELGPKVRQGDRQAPEGFYTVTPGQMNPKSQYYLSFNVGYPNAFDRAHERNGSALMVHGDCLSAGCYAMTDEQMAEIFALAREAFAGGQPSFQVQAFPFRMNALNMARHRNNPNMPFWRNLKQGHDHFEVTRQQPRVDVCEKRYVFNAQAPKSSPRLEFNAQETCPGYEVPASIASAVKEKGRKDEVATLDLIKRGTEAAPIRTGADGGMHPVFVASLKGPSFFDNDGRLRFTWNKAPGTVPPHVNPPKDASPVFAPTMAYAPETTTASLRDSVPMPRAAPRKEGGAFEIATFDERFGPFLTASVAAKPAVQSASVAQTPSFRLASADIKAAPQPVVRMVNTRVASAERALPAEDSREERQEVSETSPGPFSKMSSAVTRLFGGSANAAEPATAQAAKPRETVTASLPEAKVASHAQRPTSGGSFESRWSAFR